MGEIGQNILREIRESGDEADWADTPIEEILERLAKEENDKKIKDMKNKVWHKVTIATEEQNVKVYPNETFDGIIVEAIELDDKTESSRLYLNKDEMELLILKMREMMEYVKQ